MRRPIVIDQSDSVVATIPYADAQTGDTAIAEVHRWAGNPRVLLELSVAIDVSAKVMVLSVDPSASTRLTVSGVYDVKVKRLDGSRFTAAYGPAILRPRVTHIDFDTWAIFNSFTWYEADNASWAKMGAA